MRRRRRRRRRRARSAPRAGSPRPSNEPAPSSARGEQPAEEVVGPKDAVVPAGRGAPRDRRGAERVGGEPGAPRRELGSAPLAPARGEQARQPQREQGGAERENRFHRRSLVSSEALASLPSDGAEAVPLHSRPDARAAGGARGSRGAGSAPSRARLPRGLRARARPVAGRSTGRAPTSSSSPARARAGSSRRSSTSALPGDRVLAVSVRLLRRALGRDGADRIGCEVEELRYDWGETPTRGRPDPPAGRDRAGLARLPRALGDLDRRRRGRADARGGREGGRCARRRRRRLEPRRGAARHRRLGPRRRRRRLAEGADDAAGPRHRLRLAGGVGAGGPHDDAALLPRLGTHEEGAGEARQRVHAGGLARRGLRRRARPAARGRPRGGVRPSRAARPGLPRRDQGDGARALLSGRGPLVVS